jgi:hypothetical protein
VIRSLSRVLFSADVTGSKGASVQAAYVQSDATELGFKEEWLQNAVMANPELIISACREAGLTDERWWSWVREYPIEEVGSIDVLLVSESGRVAIVETKLSYNREGRRSVLAQLLDYAVHLPEEVERRPVSGLPPSLPVSDKAVQERIEQGDFLLVVAGDRLDSRAVKLSRSLLGDHLLNEWELALVELAIFSRAAATGPEHLIVPHLRGVIEPESRQVVKVVIAQGDKNRVIVERQAPETPASVRQKWSEERFRAELEAALLSPAYKEFGRALFDFRSQYPDVELRWGTGKTGSVTVKRNGHQLVEFYLNGWLGIRTERAPLALGKTAGEAYVEGVRKLFSDQAKHDYMYFVPPSPEESVPVLLDLLRTSLKTAEVGAG